MALKNGQHIRVPFDVLLAFSTNLNPLDLADGAFLRRIGYKIQFPTLAEEEFSKIWEQVCDDRGVSFDPQLLTFLFREMYRKEDRLLLPCEPRDLIGLALDHNRYQGKTELSEEALLWAWKTYFVKLSEPEQGHQA